MRNGIPIIRDFVDALVIITKPWSYTTERRSMKELLLFYYRFSIIPIVLSTFGTVLLTALPGTPTQHGFSSGFFYDTLIGNMDLQVFVSLVFGNLLGFWVYLPLALLIITALVELVGRGIYGWFGEGASSTFASVLYGAMPLTAFAWLALASQIRGNYNYGGQPLIVSLYPEIITPLWVVPFFALWSLVIFAFALRNQQHITKLKVLILIETVFLVLVIPLGIIFALGIFSGTL